MNDPLPWWTPGAVAAVCALLCAAGLGVFWSLRWLRETLQRRREEAERERAEKFRAMLRYLAEEGGSHRGGFLP